MGFLSVSYLDLDNTPSNSQFGQIPRLSHRDMHETQRRRNLAPVLFHQLFLSTDVRRDPKRIHPTTLGIVRWGPRSRKEICRIKEPHDQSRDRILLLGVDGDPVVAVTPGPRSSIRSGVREAVLFLSTVFAPFIVDQLSMGDVKL